MATHFRIVPVTPEVAYGVYRYRVVDSSGSVRGVSERVLVRTPAGWKVAVTTAFPTPDAAPPPIAIVGGRESGRHRDLPSCGRSEEHTSELQSRSDLVCRLLLEKKKHTIRVKLVASRS